MKAKVFFVKDDRKELVAVFCPVNVGSDVELSDEVKVVLTFSGVNELSGSFESFRVVFGSDFSSSNGVRIYASSLERRDLDYVLVEVEKR